MYPATHGAEGADSEGADVTDRITMADVAKAAGVSRATVSLALSGNETRISEETAERVRAAAAELGYVLNPSARTLRTGSSRTIGFISDQVTLTRFASEMVRGILDRAEERGYVVMMFETGLRRNACARALSTLSAHRVDGVIAGLMDSREIRLPPNIGKLCAVVVNGTSAGRPAILPDEDRAGRSAIARLLEAGHRRIGLVGRPAPTLSPHSVNIGVRMSALDSALASAGLAFADEVVCDRWEPEEGYLGTLALLQRSPDITAIVTANDRIAFGAYGAAAQLERPIAQDLSIISFDDEQIARLFHPGLTTLRIPYDLMGRAGVDALLDGAPSDTVIRIPMPIIERGSIGPVRAG